MRCGQLVGIVGAIVLASTVVACSESNDSGAVTGEGSPALNGLELPWAATVTLDPTDSSWILASDGVDLSTSRPVIELSSKSADITVAVRRQQLPNKVRFYRVRVAESNSGSRGLTPLTSRSDLEFPSIWGATPARRMPDGRWSSELTSWSQGSPGRWSTASVSSLFDAPEITASKLAKPGEVARGLVVQRQDGSATFLLSKFEKTESTGRLHSPMLRTIASPSGSETDVALGGSDESIDRAAWSFHNGELWLVGKRDAPTSIQCELWLRRATVEQDGTADVESGCIAAPGVAAPQSIIAFGKDALVAARDGDDAPDPHALWIGRVSSNGTMGWRSNVSFGEGLMAVSLVPTGAERALAIVPWWSECPVCPEVPKTLSLQWRALVVDADGVSSGGLPIPGTQHLNSTDAAGSAGISGRMVNTNPGRLLLSWVDPEGIKLLATDLSGATGGE